MSERPEIRKLHWCQITDKGELRPEDPIKWRADLARMRGRRVRVTVARNKEKRTNPQNRYYFGVVLVLLSEWCGHTEDELHNYLKRKFLAVPADLPGGGAISLVPSTADLSIDQFGQYLDYVIAWAAEHGVYIPEPHEVEVTA